VKAGLETAKARGAKLRAAEVGVPEGRSGTVAGHRGVELAGDREAAGRASHAGEGSVGGGSVYVGHPSSSILEPSSSSA